MTTPSHTQPQTPARPVKPLVKVLDESEQAKTLVEDAAQDLSDASAVLRQEVADNKAENDHTEAAAGIEDALQKTETAEDKVQSAADKLSVVNQALKHEVRERHVLEFRLAAATERAEASRNAAFHDPLTGLPNRALFGDRLEHGLAQAIRHGWQLAVMFIDLDRFKSINDLYGHSAGDDVLRTMAARLSANTRDDDTISRHGGDEFLYLLTQVSSEDDLVLVAQKLLASIALPCVVRVDGVPVDPIIGASIGIAVFPRHGVTAQDLIAAADKAMYQAKGNDRHYAFAP